MSSPPRQTDILIITAVQDEFDIVKDIESDWQENTDQSGFSYLTRVDRGISWALARSTGMGPESAANIATRLISFLKPRCLAMVGMCAGYRKSVFLGDIIVAERLFRYDTGKLKVSIKNDELIENVFHDITTYNLDPRWKQSAEDLKLDWSEIEFIHKRPISITYQSNWLLSKLREKEGHSINTPSEIVGREKNCPNWTQVIERLENREFIEFTENSIRLTESGQSFITELRLRYPDEIPNDPQAPSIHVVPMATGSRLMVNENIFPTIQKHLRKTAGLDMEGSAIASVAEIERVDQCIIVKGVQDYADHDKDDLFRKYAIEASYRFLIRFLDLHFKKKEDKNVFILPQQEINHFTGREAELQILEESLLGPNQDSNTVSIAGVSGTGGIGKSAIAVHFAHLHRDKFPGGIIGIRVDRKEPGYIARQFAYAIGEKVDEEDTEEPGLIMQALFRNREALLIFDNVESPDIRSLIPGGKSKVIITTRDRSIPISLNIRQSSRIDIPVLSESESVDLMRLKLGDKYDDLETSAKVISKTVGYLPLALQIISANLQLREWIDLKVFVKELSEERQKIAKLSVKGDPKLDIRASFNLSLRSLSHGEIEFLASCSVCDPDGFSINSAAASTSRERVEAQEILDMLYRHSLINTVEQASSVKFVLHPVIRELSKEKALNLKIFEQAEKRHANYFIELVNRSSKSDEDKFELKESLGDLLIASNWLLKQKELNNTFLANIKEILEISGQWQEAERIFRDFLNLAITNNDAYSTIHLSIQIARFLALQGRIREANLILEESITVAEIENIHTQKTLASFWNTLGTLRQRIGNFDASLNALKKALESLSELDFHGHAKTLNSLGGVLQRMGRFDEAVKAFEESYNLLKQLEDERGQAMVLNSLGGVLQRMGRFDEAVKAFEESRKISESLQDQRSIAMVLNSLGGVLQRMGRFDEAVKAFEESVSIGKEIEDKRHIAMVLNSLGGVLQRMGRFDEAVKAFEESYNLLKQLEDERGQAMVLNSLGGVLQRMGRFDEAVKAFEESRKISESLQDQRSIAMVLNSLGGVLQRMGRFDEAVKAFEESRKISESLQDQRSIAMVLNSLGGVLQRMGRFDEAVKAFEESVSIGKEIEDKRHIAMVLNSLGGVLQRMGRFDEAVKAFEESYNLLKQLEDERGQAMVLNSLGGVLQRMGRFDEAVKAFEESRKISESLQDQRSIAMVLNSLGGVLQRMGRFDEAVKAFEESRKISESLQDQRSIAMVLNSLGGVLQRMGRFDEAVKAFEESYNLLKQLEDERGQAMVLNSLGGVLQRMGRFDEAVKAFEESVSIGKEIEDKRHIAMVLNSLGGVLQRMGRFDEAVKAFEESKAIRESLNDQLSIAKVLNSLGGVLQRMGRFEEAVKAFERSFNLLKQLKDERGQAMVLNSLGGVFQRINQTQKSDEAFKKSIAIGESLKDELHLAKVHTSYGKVWLQRNDIEKAILHLKQGFDFDEKKRNSRGISIVTPSLHKVLTQTGQLEKAREYLERALKVEPVQRSIKQLAIYYQLDTSTEFIKIKGTIKRKLEPVGRLAFGFIQADNYPNDIYFSANKIGDELFTQLKEGQEIKADIIKTSRGHEAVNIYN